MHFIYTALAKDGRKFNGEYEGADRAALIAVLAKQGAHPILIKTGSATSSKKTGLQALFTPKVKLISAGVPLPRSLATLQQQAESDHFKQVIGEINKDIEGGTSLGAAFGKFPEVFSAVYINMVKAGEAGGILDEILKRLAAQSEKDATIRKKVKGAMTYPTVIFTVTILAFFGLMIFVIPQIGKILLSLGGPHAKLPIYTRVLLDISNFCTSNSFISHIPLIGALPLISLLPNLIFLLILAGIGGYYLRRYIHTPAGSYKLDELLLKVPVIKVVIIKVAIARFARTFSALTSAGVTVLDAIQITGAAIGNQVIQDELKRAAEEVRNGRALSEPLSKSKIFPPIVSQMIAVGEETGQIDKILVKIADFYEEDVDTLIDSLSSIIEPVMIVVLGALVGLIAVSVMGPIASLSTNVNPNS
jgi:type IV pilus assembly protein PilC